MASELSVTELARNFSDFVDRVHHRGESFVVTRGKRPVAELRPVPTGRRLADLPALLASLPRLSPQDCDDWEADLDAARRQLAEVEMADPWRS